ncbi:MAG: hypothetical protein QOD77_246 [Thermoplasmata archaeon]|jgi:hypothetical protein|nr:hypothetical protein [Thermoplasmata archaeon]
MALEGVDWQLLRNLLAIPTAAVYMTVGFVVGRREVSREARPANLAFQAWWHGLAALTLFTPLIWLLDVLGVGGFELRLYLVEVLLLALVVAIACLVYYLLYVYTGKAWVMWPVAGYHLLAMAWLSQLITIGQPVAYGSACPDAGFCYQNDIMDSSAAQWIGVILVLPIVLSALAYFALFFRMESRAQKYRIAMVAGALFVWFGSSLVASVLDAAANDAWTLASNLIGLGAALLILAAYRPPAMIRAKLA